MSHCCCVLQFLDTWWVFVTYWYTSLMFLLALYFIIWRQMFIALFWQMLLPCFDVVDVTTTRQVLCLCYSLADVLPTFVNTCGRCCCHIIVWVMFLPFDVYYWGRCYCHHWLFGWCCCHLICVAIIVWQMLLPMWLMLLPFDSVDVICVADVIAKVADGIAYHGGCGLWSDVITIGGRWNSHRVTLFLFQL